MSQMGPQPPGPWRLAEICPHVRPRMLPRVDEGCDLLYCNSGRRHRDRLSAMGSVTGQTDTPGKSGQVPRSLQDSHPWKRQGPTPGKARGCWTNLSTRFLKAYAAPCSVNEAKEGLCHLCREPGSGLADVIPTTYLLPPRQQVFPPHLSNKRRQIPTKEFAPLLST